MMEKFKASLGYIARPCHKKPNLTNKQIIKSTEDFFVLHLVTLALSSTHRSLGKEGQIVKRWP
jgi:hypothetical protein